MEPISSTTCGLQNIWSNEYNHKTINIHFAVNRENNCQSCKKIDLADGKDHFESGEH